MMEFDIKSYILTEISNSGLDLNTIKSYDISSIITTNTFTPKMMLTFEMTNGAKSEMSIGFSNELVQDLKAHGYTGKSNMEELKKYLNRRANLNNLLEGESE